MGDYEVLKKALSGGSVGSKLGSTAGQGKRQGGIFSERWAPPWRYTDKKSGKVYNPPAEPIVLLEGDYKLKARTQDGMDIEFQYPFWLYIDHFNASKSSKRKSCVCSAGIIVELDEQGQPRFSVGNEPCIPCHYIDEEGAGGRDGYLSRSLKSVFSAVVLKWFHPISQQGKPDFQSCLGRSCKLCELGVPRQFGRRVFWPMGNTWVEYLRAKNDILQKTCGCGGQLSYLNFSCPECQKVLRDFEEDPADGDEIEQYKGDMICPYCKETITPEEEIQCDECENPKSVDLWSTVLKPVRIGEKYTPDLESWRALKDKEIDALQQFKPVNFAKFLKPSTLAEQSEWFGLKNPFADYGKATSSEWE